MSGMPTVRRPCRGESCVAGTGGLRHRLISKAPPAHFILKTTDQNRNCYMLVSLIRAAATPSVGLAISHSSIPVL